MWSRVGASMTSTVEFGNNKNNKIIKNTRIKNVKVE
jgi:hypothetical protein